MSGPALSREIPHRAHRRWDPLALGVAVGAVVMTAGTFAPWLGSGTSARNLYSSAGLVQRLAGLGRPVGLALDALPLTGLYCIAAGVAYVIGRRRIAGGAIGLLAFVFAGIAVAALAHRRPGQIHLLAVGPSVTLVGALIVLATLLVAAGRQHHDARATRSLPAWPIGTTSTNATATDAATNATSTGTPSSTDPSPSRPRTMEFR